MANGFDLSALFGQTKGMPTRALDRGNIMSVTLNIHAVEVSEDIANMVARIADLNEAIALSEKENKALKAELIETVGGSEMVELFAEGIRVTHNGTALATVKSATRTTVTADRVSEVIAGILAAFPQIGDMLPEAVRELESVATTAGKVSTYPVIRTK